MATYYNCCNSTWNFVVLYLFDKTTIHKLFKTLCLGFKLRSVSDTIVPIPFRVGFRVKNTPAVIKHNEIEIKYKPERIFFHEANNAYRFPDDKSEWSFTIGKAEFEKIMNRPDVEKLNLTRTIRIKYVSLSGGKEYNYELQQSFEPLENQWKDYYESAE